MDKFLKLTLSFTLSALAWNVPVFLPVLFPHLATRETLEAISLLLFVIIGAYTALVLIQGSMNQEAIALISNIFIGFVILLLMFLGVLPWLSILFIKAVCFYAGLSIVECLVLEKSAFLGNNPPVI